jgi:protein-tyrosine phosphatase
MIPDLYWIAGPWRGRLAIISRPRGGDWLQDEVNAWRQAGIDVVISLLEPDEAAQLDLADEPRAAEANGIQFISFPIPDRCLPASLPASISLMADGSQLLDEAKTVGVHCRQSVGRSGLLAAGILTAAGVRPDEAIKMVSAARGIAVPETVEQLLWVQRLIPAAASLATRYSS